MGKQSTSTELTDYSTDLNKYHAVNYHLETVEKDIFEKFKFYGYPELEDQYNTSEFNDWDRLWWMKTSIRQIHPQALSEFSYSHLQLSGIPNAVIVLSILQRNLA
ncbi:MAG: hypothetical protein PVI99_07170 [Anaerolineales bacterium]